MKIGLALGGGAARGLSHIGVLRAFEEEGLPVGVITGTSMGAIIGALYALTEDSFRVRDRVEAYLASDVFRRARLDFLKEKDEEAGNGIFYRFSSFVRKGIFLTHSLTRQSFISQETADANLEFLLPDAQIEDLSVPFATTAVDILTGNRHVFFRGSLRKAVSASCALPGILPPVPLDGMLLVDGGWLDAVPVEAARLLGADLVAGVDVCGELRESDDIRNSLDVVFRADQVSRYALARLMVTAADVLIEPAVCAIHWADFKNLEEIIEQGRQSGLRAVKEIRGAVSRGRLSRLLRRILGR